MSVEASAYLFFNGLGPKPDVEPLSPTMQAAHDGAVSKLERAFGKWDRERGCYVPHAVPVSEAA